MNKFEIKQQNFYIDGKEELLLCGEIHYFRMPKEAWESALDSLVEAGCNAVAYYVPWFVHEYEEGKFDFSGEVHPDNDLHTWIALTEKKGLLGFLRPGPYVYAESTDLGIPRWFQEKCPTANVKTYVNGEYKNCSRVNAVAHNHPEFLKAVSSWYKAVCENIANYIAPKGNVVMVQLCNEIPGDDYDDRNPENLGIGKEDGIYPSYLKAKYKDIASLNQRYLTNFESFIEVEPHMLEAANDKLAMFERLEFYYTHYYPTYFSSLKEIMKENKIQTNFIHNAYNPRAISLHYHNKKKNPWLHIGVDCYYSLSGNLGLKDATYYCDFGAEYSKRFLQDVPWVIEQECGYWNDYPFVYGPELYIWNIWTIASGYKGLNMYLFASGKNRPGMGFFGTDHNWQAPVNEYGEKTETYSCIKDSLSEIQKNKHIFMAENQYDIAFGMKNDPGLIWKPVAKDSNEAFYALKSEGYNPRIVDYAAADIHELKEYPTLFVVSDEEMESYVQEKLCEYVKQGGFLILNGKVPYLDMEGKACTLLANELGICVEKASKKYPDQEKICYEEVEYYIGQTVQEISYGEETKVLGTTQEGKVGIMHMLCGKGQVLILPFSLKIVFQSTCKLIRRVLESVDVNPTIKGAFKLRVILKETKDAIVLNLHPVTVKEIIRIGAEEVEQELPPYSYKVIKLGA